MQGYFFRRKQLRLHSSRIPVIMKAGKKVYPMKKQFSLSSSALHILAMGLMLCDHLWATIVPGNDWMTCAGRLAFPIFAFLLVEGYFHTHSVKKYALRLLTGALVSEIPFNLMCTGSPFFPFHQNVLWTLLIGLGMIHLCEKAQLRDGLLRRILTCAGAAVLGVLLGTFSFCDYGAAGVLTILLFYFFRGHRAVHTAGQIAGLYWINFELLKGLSYSVELFGKPLSFPQQGFALLAWIPIRLYSGEKGITGRWFRILCYGFYPAHMLLLWLIGRFL